MQALRVNLPCTRFHLLQFVDIVSGACSAIKEMHKEILWKPLSSADLNLTIPAWSLCTGKASASVFPGTTAEPLGTTYVKSDLRAKQGFTILLKTYKFRPEDRMLCLVCFIKEFCLEISANVCVLLVLLLEPFRTLP